MAALCQRLGDERGDALAHPRGDYVHQLNPRERAGAHMKSPGRQQCASAWVMSVETHQRIHMAIMCTS